MKTSIKKLIRIFRFINPEWFYHISFDAYEIHLQGEYHSDKVKFFRSLKFSVQVDDNGYVDCQRNNIRITLTEKT